MQAANLLHSIVFRFVLIFVLIATSSSILISQESTQEKEKAVNQDPELTDAQKERAAKKAEQAERRKKRRKPRTRQLKFSRQEKLRGAVTPEREWWDLMHYDLKVEFFPERKYIKGSNLISFTTLEPSKRMQIDLQTPLAITKVEHGEKSLKYEREGNVYWITFENELPKGDDQIKIFYEGTPTESKLPPWEGGITWDKDEKENHFIATTCQGIGASIWWPNKDHGYDEPDNGTNITVTVPDDLVAVSNGRLIKTEHDKDQNKKTFYWQVKNPINNYSVNVNIGKYVNYSEKFKGEAGELDIDYWVLDHQRAIAEKQFREVPRTLKAFEHWFGKYPFYEDSYKLVVVPYTGMEHQSSVTYGNGFKNGYGGKDLSKTGVGLKFDFIIIHESGHEWFGNNVSMKDAADMWIHESFTNYSENLFVEYHFTEKEAQDYVIGCRALVKNDIPIIGTYNVNNSGSGDVYYKGGNMLHTMRHILNDDEKWRNILRGLNSTFWHQTVTSKQVESYINEQSGIDFTKLYDQYLRTTKIPVLKYALNGKQLNFHFENVVEGFSFRVRVKINGKDVWITPTEKAQTLDHDSEIDSFELDRNFYMTAEKA